MTKAYLVKLSGMGDHEWKLLDQEAWDHLNACCSWGRTQDLPKPSEALVAAIAAWVVEDSGGDMPEDEAMEEAVELLTMNPRSSSADNDVAMSMPGSLFNGERFHSFDASVKQLNAFVAKHQLDLEEAYEGYIY